MTQFLRSALLAALSCAAACSSYKYDQVKLSLPVQGTTSVALTTLDSRPYVRNGDKNPSFVGLERNGYGMPFSQSTQDGRPLADNFSSALVGALVGGGFRASSVPVPYTSSGGAAVTQLKGQNAERLLLLTMKEWKTDALIDVWLHYDLELGVYSKTGKLLATKSVSGKDSLDGSFWNPSVGASNAATKAFGTKIQQLFADAEVQSALQ